MRKKLKLIMLCVLSSLMFLACENETDFLTAENVNSPDADNFIVDRTTAEATVFGIYSALQFQGVMGGSATYTLETMSVTCKAPHYAQNGGAAALSDLTFSSDGGFTLQSFQHLYQLIDRANVVISSVGNLEKGVVAEDIRLILLSEAHFLRALGYFWVVTTFEPGNIPLITEPGRSVEQIRANANNIKSTEEIYAQIESDLKFAQQYLPYNNADRNVIIDGQEVIIRPWTETYKGRATWGAATGYLGKIYLYQEKNGEAVTEFDKIVNGVGSSHYSLVPNVFDNSNIEGEWNSESIFEVGFAQSPQVTTGNFGGGEGATLNETTTRGFLFNWQKGGWGIVHSSSFITELMKSDIVDENNPINYKDGNINNKAPENFSGYSKRCNSAIAFNGDGAQFYDLDLTVGEDQVSFTRSGSRIKKFTNWWLDREPGQAVSEINERLMRLTDVYLMYAEALLKDQGNAGVSEAVTYINMVRQRAGVIDLETLFSSERNYLEGPQNPDALTERIPLGIRSVNSADDVLTHLLNEERIIEFAFEGRGITWHDTNRRQDTGAWISFISGIVHGVDTTEFEEAAEKLVADEEAGYFSIPAIELLGR